MQIINFTFKLVDSKIPLFQIHIKAYLGDNNFNFFNQI